MAWVPWTDVTGIEGIESTALFCYITMIYWTVEVFDLQLLWQCYGSLQSQRRLFPQPSGPLPVVKGIDAIKSAAIRNNGVFDLTAFEANVFLSQGKPYQTRFLCFSLLNSARSQEICRPQEAKICRKQIPLTSLPKEVYKKSKVGLGDHLCSKGSTSPKRVFLLPFGKDGHRYQLWRIRPFLLRLWPHKDHTVS